MQSNGLMFKWRKQTANLKLQLDICNACAGLSLRVVTRKVLRLSMLDFPLMLRMKLHVVDGIQSHSYRRMGLHVQVT